MNFQSKSKDELLQELLLLKSELDSTLNVKDQLIAEFKTKENLWHQNEERLMYAIEGASDGLWDWDITNNTVFFSKQWKSMLGYEESEIGNTLDEWSKRVHPDDLSKTMELVNRHLNNETEMYSSEHRVICKDGSLKWILDEGKVIARDSDGKALRAIGTHKDITAKKQIINDFQQSEARYKTLFQDGVSVILVINPDSCEIVDANNAACKYYNWSHDEICRKKIYEINIMKKEDLESEMKLAKEEKRSYFNFKHRLSNGEIRDVEIFSGPVKFNDITLLYSHIQDVTERKRTENALKESEEKLNNIIQSQIDGIGFVNQNEVFEFANHAACKIFELEIDELIGKSLFDFLSKTEANNIKQQNRDRKKGISNSYEIRINTKKGIKYLQVSGAPKFDTDNTFLGTYGTFSDITNRKLAEIALHESEEKFSKAFQTSPYAISISTIEEGKFIEVNDAFTKISGYSMEEVISDSGAGLNIWANSEDREKVISVLREGKDIVNLECIFKKRMAKSLLDCYLQKSFTCMVKPIFYRASMTSVNVKGLKKHFLKAAKNGKPSLQPLPTA
jgi:PAS domain S-box-containing protein